ncbi:MAG: factor activating pos9 [Piccolia ochrophora]|nr:MAG: factor activating pos9 [Piccolia ochrophora]
MASSKSTMRQEPNIIVTGTPGVGKSSHAELLSSNTGLKLVSVNRVVTDRECHEGWDEQHQSWILLDSLEEEVPRGGCIIDWHACEVFPKSWIDLVVVLRADSTILYDRLTSRHYTPEKLGENIDAEIMQVILEEARESYDEELIVELRSDTAEDMESNVERIQTWIRNWKGNNAGADT